MIRHECKCIHCGTITGWTPDPARVGVVCRDCGWRKRFENAEGGRRVNNTMRRLALDLVGVLNKNLYNYELTGDRLDIVNLNGHVNLIVERIADATRPAEGWDWLAAHVDYAMGKRLDLAQHVPLMLRISLDRRQA